MDRTPPPRPQPATRPSDDTRRVHNPHDAWFTAILEEPRRAGDLLRTVLPSGLVAQLSDTLPERVSGMFLDHNLRRRFGDLVFHLQRRPGFGPAPLYVIIEHQSTIDPLMAIRTLVYKAQLMERLASRKEKGAPQVVVVVLYHGQRPWNTPLAIEESVLSNDPARPERFRHFYFLCDLARRKESELGSDPVLRAALRLSCLAFRTSVRSEEIADALRPIPVSSRFAGQAVR